jgi:hypothetical protein
MELSEWKEAGLDLQIVCAIPAALEAFRLTPFSPRPRAPGFRQERHRNLRSDIVCWQRAPNLKEQIFFLFL